MREAVNRDTGQLRMFGNQTINQWITEAGHPERRNLRWYVVNEPEQKGMSAQTAAAFTSALIDQLTVNGIVNGVVVSPAFSSDAFDFGQGSPPLIRSAGPNAACDGPSQQEYPYAEAWVRWMQQCYPTKLPLIQDFSFHAYPSSGNVANNTTAAVNEIKTVANAVQQLFQNRNYHPCRVILSETGAPFCEYGGPPGANWNKAVDFATALANALKDGSLAVDDVCWFLGRSNARRCTSPGTPSGSGIGGFLIYSDVDPDGTGPHTSNCGDQPWAWAGNCITSDQQPKGSGMTPIGTAWSAAASS